MFTERRRALATAAAALALGGVGGGSALRAQGLSEPDIKAAYLFNFARFAEWPAAAFVPPTAPFRLCSLGTGQFDAALRQLDGKAIRDRALSVRIDVGLDAVADCQLVYVGEADAVRLPAVRTVADRRAILIVGEGDAALERGAMIAFRPVERRLGFAVDLAAVRRAGVKLPAQLLALAVEVRQ
jgi:hypothetical protein